MSKLSRYIIPCITENKNIITDYRYTIPDKCPNNETHAINENGVYLLDTVETNLVSIEEGSDTLANGFFRIDNYNIPIGIGTTTYDIVYPYNIGCFAVTITPTNDNIGDIFNIVGSPNTLIGEITENISVGINTLPISLYAPKINNGFNISISDGINTSDCGEIISFDNDTIICSKSLTHDFNAGSKIYISISRLRNYKIMNSYNCGLGFSKIGSSGLPANTIIRVEYINNSGIEKEFNIVFEIQY